MNRRHAEPQRVHPVRCSTCGLPNDEAVALRLMNRLPERDDLAWMLCSECGANTCPELQALCARQALGEET